MKSYFTKSMLKTVAVAAALAIPVAVPWAKAVAAPDANSSVIDGLDYGPLAGLVGTWKSAASGGVDFAPGQTGSAVGKGGPAVSPYFETFTFEPAGDVTNASDQNLVAMHYREQVFRKSNNKQFHDQTGYLIYDKKNQMVYDSFCLPRAVCVVAEGKPGSEMTLTSQEHGVAESQYMVTNDNTARVTITLGLSGGTLKYREQTTLQVYGKPFTHLDSDALTKVN